MNPSRKWIFEIKEGLLTLYREADAKQNQAFLKAVQTLKKWQTEILNSYVFGY